MSCLCIAQTGHKDFLSRTLMEARYLRDYNWTLLACVVVLLIIGTLSVYSATLNAITAYGTPLSTIFPNHLGTMAIGLVAMFIVSLINYRLITGLARPLYLVTIPALTMVLLAGVVSEGARSRISLGTRTFQPSEFAKIVLIIALAAYWQHYEEKKDTWPVMLGSLVLAGIPLLLVFVQPDLGSAVVYAAIWFIMAWGAGLRWSQLLALIALAAPVLYVGWVYVLDDFQHVRLLTFYWILTDPSQADPDASYNIVQALNAIGAGGLYGSGLNQGLFSQGNYVPVQHSDFIFAVIGEELGFVGAVVMLIFQAILLWQALTIAGRARDLFGRLIAIGVFGLLLSHLVINVGMNLSILPVTGLPLPLISHGGTFMITVLICLGLLQSIAMRWRKLSFQS